MKTASLALLASLAAWCAPNPSIILGRPTDRSVTLNVLADARLEVYVEHGTQPDKHSTRSPVGHHVKLLHSKAARSGIHCRALRL